MLKHLLLLNLFLLLIKYPTAAQRYERPYEDERRFYLDVGVGGGVSKASRAYAVQPLFLANTRLSWQVFAAPHYIVSERLNLGLQLGGVFRPKFDDAESNSTLQGKFTPYGVLFADYYLGAGGYKRVRPYLGFGVGATYIGELEARHNQTDAVYYLRRKDRDVFLTLVPRVGVAFRELKVQAEYLVTTPFNPDIFCLTLISTIPLGRPRYY
ncbi:hypothetical protein GCM10027275_55550 [Rhabdobacter roseus]|uniref:Outer membrane protein beta-barrel domain-containing protein n=1 Tax=Rhabdobacter roseus TaxID=1655419 RepID=A0A840TWC2_9BACT|nr:hypothetical protein [Rhabdobacter roseus]MBB5287544.1 hypothetical protein [Rhabdobacter roseus]